MFSKVNPNDSFEDRLRQSSCYSWNQAQLFLARRGSALVICVTEVISSRCLFAYVIYQSLDPIWK